MVPRAPGARMPCPTAWSQQLSTSPRSNKAKPSWPVQLASAWCRSGSAKPSSGESSPRSGRWLRVAPYEAERALNEVVIDAAATLSRLDVAAGARPAPASAVMLAPGYSTRQRATAERAARLLAACDAALLDDGASISSFEADRRAAELRRVRAKAGEALGSAVSWLR